MHQKNDVYRYNDYHYKHEISVSLISLSENHSTWVVSRRVHGQGWEEIGGFSCQSPCNKRQITKKTKEVMRAYAARIHNSVKDIVLTGDRMYGKTNPWD